MLLIERNSELFSESFDHVLDADFVAADDHMVVLGASYPFAALRQHREIFIADRRVQAWQRASSVR